jgi:hypothetical protein
VYAATAGIDGVSVELTSHGSRSRDHAFDVHLVAEQRKGRRRGNSGSYGAGYDYAATWDEWGIFFAHLFAIDPEMTCYAYDGADDYHWQTNGRFRLDDDGRPDFVPHDQHRWEWNQDTSPPDVHVSECVSRVPGSDYTCGAVRRFRLRVRVTS